MHKVHYERQLIEHGRETRSQGTNPTLAVMKLSVLFFSLYALLGKKSEQTVLDLLRC